MAFFETNNVKIAGLSAGVPLEKRYIKDEENISSDYDVSSYIESTGVEQRRYSDKLTISDLCVPAANQLLKDLGWQKETVDAIVLVTQTPDYLVPATSCIIQDQMGLSKECLAMDISLGCSGWVYGLGTLAGLLSNGNMKRALLMVGDAKQNYEGKSDILFGSAGTITALEYCEGESFKFHCGTDGSGWDAIYVPDGGSRNPFNSKTLEYEGVDGKQLMRIQSRMKGMDVFSFAISTAPKSIKKLMEHFSIEKETIDYYVLHQANKLIIDSVIKKLKITEDVAPQCMRFFGNTSSASIPLTIVTQMDGIINGKIHLICCGFGVGLSWGSVYVTIDENTIISKLVEVE